MNSKLVAPRWYSPSLPPEAANHLRIYQSWLLMIWNYCRILYTSVYQIELGIIPFMSFSQHVDEPWMVNRNTIHQQWQWCPKHFHPILTIPLPFHDSFIRFVGCLGPHEFHGLNMFLLLNLRDCYFISMKFSGVEHKFALQLLPSPICKI